MKEQTLKKRQATLLRFINGSKVYKNILKHRRSCKKWSKDFCKSCFGEGLNIYVINLNKEFMEKKKWQKKRSTIKKK